MKPTARVMALDVIMDVVLGGRPLSSALPMRSNARTSDRERALAQELAYGVMRWGPRLEAVVDALVKRPMRERDRDVKLLLMLGIYQLAETRVPPHAAVSETVQLCARIGKGWANGLANAVLRAFTRDRNAILARVCMDDVARFAHPRWILDAVRDAWPDCWPELLDASNARPPMVLRVNTRLQTREHYLQRLEAQGMHAQALAHVPTGVVLAQAVETAALPGFAEGAVSVQDGAAQLAVPLLGARSGDRVLDACAAPGGKTCHIIEATPAPADLVAVDVSDSRLELIRQNLVRIGASARLIADDASRPERWWDGKPFDRILLDAPCTATGVVRRHPDIKYTRSPGDVDALVKLQEALLDAVWPLLVRGGVLLYATCSLFPAENQQQVQRFLSRTRDASAVPFEATWGRKTSVGRQVLPNDEQMDGFYYALLAKA